MPWKRKWHPTPVLLLGKSHWQRSLVGCSPWGRKESYMTARLHFHFSLSCTGEGNGNPLQGPCLENPRDGGAWWASVYGVAQSRTRLKRLSSSSSYLGFLPVHVCHHPEDPLGWGIPEGFIHLRISPHCSLHLLRDRRLHELPAQLPSFHDADKTAPVFYTVVIPVLNPVVHSLRNKAKSAFKKAIQKEKSSPSFIS